MKQITRFVCFLLLFAMLLPTNVFAAEAAVDTQIIYLEDGSYITIEITTAKTRATSTTTGRKTYTYNGNDGVELWRVILSGSFTYNGTTSACANANCSVSITDDAWYVISKTSGKSGSSATADVTMGRKLLGITVNKETINITLTCDANGNLS